MPVITCIDDLKKLHKRRTPKMFYDYCESGSYTEQTFRENTTDFQKLRLRQKVAVDMSGRSTAASMSRTADVSEERGVAMRHYRLRWTRSLTPALPCAQPPAQAGR